MGGLNKFFYCTLGLFLLCRVGYGQTNMFKTNLSHAYDLRAEVQLEHFQVEKGTKILTFCQVKLEERPLEYVFVRNLRYGYKSAEILKSDTLRHNEMIRDGGDGYYYLQFLTDKSMDFSLIEINVITPKGRTFVFDLPLPKENNKNNFYLMRLKESIQLPFFKKYINTIESFNFMSLMGDTTALYFYKYQTNFKMSVPPFVDPEQNANKALSIDSVFAYNQTDSLELSEGLYFVQSDTSGANGYGFLTEDRYFPKYATLDKLIDPLTYITTRSEQLQFEAAKKNKEDFERVWLDIAKSPERGKMVIKYFYRRVAEANIFFTSFKQGWKTDMGMIYIIFGRPDQVYRDGQKEEWVYGPQYGLEQLKFSFVRIDNIFTKNHFVLVRHPKYKNPWMLMVDNWRKGRVE